jgi:methylated-DNA-[protein]-cysteine S-methyltransferase
MLWTICSAHPRLQCGTEMATSSSGLSAAVISSQLGWVCVVAREARLVAASLPSPTKNAAMASCGVTPGAIRREELLEAVCDDLRRYLLGEAVGLGRHPVDVSRHPPFYRRALEVAQEIPYGETRTYGWVAAQAGRPRGARAVGQAMSHNTVPLVIPCHRVVAAGGRLGGFGGGLTLKRALLRLEGVRWQHPASSEADG